MDIMFTLKPQDVVVLLKILGMNQEPSYSSLAYELSMSPSEVHAAVKRAAAAGLIDLKHKQVRRQALLEFLIHGVKYAYPAIMGPITRGLPTAHAAAPLIKKMAASDSLPPVWPCPDGETRGYELPPLYSSVPKAVRNDQSLYELLALVDAIRAGRARERKLAETELTRRIKIA